VNKAYSLSQIFHFSGSHHICFVQIDFPGIT
jgi:hypothetical protein